MEHLEERVVPATFIWSGLGGNNNWSTAANWQGGVAPSEPCQPGHRVQLASRRD